LKLILPQNGSNLRTQTQELSSERREDGVELLVRVCGCGNLSFRYRVPLFLLSDCEKNRRRTSRPHI